MARSTTSLSTCVLSRRPRSLRKSSCKDFSLQGEAVRFSRISAMKANRSTNEKRTIAGTPRNDGTGLVASASVLPLAWTDYAWNVEISMCGPGLVTQFPFLPVIAMDNVGTMSVYHKPRTRRVGTVTSIVINDNVVYATATVATVL